MINQRKPTNKQGFLSFQMLTYENLNVGLKVEVSHNGKILKGTVLYKGPMTSRPGIWIGIDLTTPDGDNDGTLKGRVYFRAPMNYGIFTTIDNVRLATNIRRKFVFISQWKKQESRSEKISRLENDRFIEPWTKKASSKKNFSEIQVVSLGFSFLLNKFHF